jgi:RecG-like helicase
MRVQPWSGVAALELIVIDDTGALTVVFFGRRHLSGVATGTKLIVDGMVGEHHGTVAMLKPGLRAPDRSQAHRADADALRGRTRPRPRP